MNLLELRDTANNYIQRTNNPDEITVYVKLDESSVGGTAVSKVKNAHVGFDWDKDKFIIVCDDELMTKRANSVEELGDDMVKEVMEMQEQLEKIKSDFTPEILTDIIKRLAVDAYNHGYNAAKSAKGN